MRGYGILKKWIGLIGVLFFFIAMKQYAEASVLPSVFSTGAGYKATLYNSNNGLPTSEANAIVQTNDGYIWIGSYSGLICYDGINFERYDASSGISSVTELFVDSEGRLWVGTNDEGIALYTEDGNFRFFKTDTEETLASIRKITEDINGNIIIGTTSGVAYIDTTLQLKKIEDAKLDGEYINDLDTDSEGNIIGVTSEGDLFEISHFEVTEFQTADTLSFGVAKAIFVDPDSDNIYIGTDGEYLYEFDSIAESQRYAVKYADTLAGINRIYKDGNGFIWICADNGISYINQEGSCVKIEGLEMNSSVDDMMMDYEGSLWFASSRQGIMKVVENKFTDISEKAGLENIVANTVEQSGDILYIGTDEGLFILNDHDTLIQNELTDMLTGQRIRCVREDSAGNVWICSYGSLGLIEYDADGSILSYTEDQGLPNNKTRDILEMTNGDMAVATNSGVCIIREHKIYATYGKAEGIENTEILDLCEGEDGTLYAGSDGGGLYQIKDGEVVKCYDKSSGLKSNVIMQIKKDPTRDAYWIITGNSIAVLENQTIRNISSFPYSNNFDLYWNEAGEVWIISSNGIYVLAEENLYEDTVEIKRYWNAESGMPSNVTANSKNYLSKDGILYLAGSSSVFRIDMQDTSFSCSEKKIAISHIEIDGVKKYINVQDTLVLPSDCKRLVIYADVLSYNLDDTEIEYYLEGFEEEKQVVAKEELTNISYTNLAGKNYTFHILVYNGNTGEQISELQLAITKEKSLFESTWFFVIIGLLCVVLLLFTFLFLVWLKNRKLKKEEQKKRLFVNQIVGAFAKLIDGKDKYTNGHSFRVAQYSTLIASKMEYDAGQIENIHNIALLHDIGKISIPDSILQKNEKLTEEEYQTIKKHTEFGYEVLKEITVYPEISLGARFHHERLDGKGYPLALSGDEIPLIARIIAVADTFDAMYSTRPYRKQMPIEEVIKVMQQAEGTQLDQEIVEILVQLVKEEKIS